MSPSLIVTLEITLVLGGLLGFAGWELWQLRSPRSGSESQTTLPLPSEDEGQP